MIDTLEKMNIQDLAFAKVFNMDITEVEVLSLHQMKNEMHNKAFRMRENKTIITQHEADKLNKRLDSIISELENRDVDTSSDYMINFDSFVPENEYYNRFAW